MYIVILQTPTLNFKTMYCVTLDKVNGVFWLVELFILFAYDVLQEYNIHLI